MPDSGANVDAIGPDSLKRLQLSNNSLKKSGKADITAANGSTFTNIGSFSANIRLSGHSVDTTVQVVEELRRKPMILKWTTCQALRILSHEFPLPHTCSSSHVMSTGTTIAGSAQAKRVSTSSGKARAASPQSVLRSLMDEYSDVFGSMVTNKMKGDEFRIQLTPDAAPFSVRACRRVPVPILGKLKKELDQMEAQGIIRKITEPTQWCAPIVIVPKKQSDEIRVCTDFSRLNQFIVRERYFSPTPSELISQVDLSKCQYFTVMDALKGYYLVPLDEQSQPLTTFITPQGRYCYRVAPMGLSSISEHYNRRMDQAFDDLKSVRHIVDDCLIASASWEEHVEDVRNFLQRCREHGISLNDRKITFGQKCVTFAGLQISSSGYSLDPQLIKALRCFPTPTNKSDIRSFFGLVNQLSSVSDQIARLLTPLQPLLRKDTVFRWDDEFQRAFEEARRELTKIPLCVSYFDSSKPTRMSTDASRLNGIGFVIRQQHPDGHWRVIQAGSRFLTDTEKRYAMIEIEMSAIVWAMSKGRMFLEGLKHFDLWTDHKP